MGQARNYKQTTAAPTTSPADIVALNPTRCALIIFNTGAIPVLIGIGSATITVAAGNHLAFTDEDAPMNNLTASVASGTGALTIWEA